MEKTISGKVIDKKQAWILATRPKTLILACVPVLVGTTLAYKAEWPIWYITLLTIIVALSVQIGTNLINDAFDFKRGADTALRIGPQRATQSCLLPINNVIKGGLAAFTLALICGIPLILVGGWSIALLLILSVLCGYLYTGGPYPLAYHGLGEVFVLLFFGLFSTLATYYLQVKSIDPKTLLAGLQIGLLANVLLAINNLRDRREDAKVNKNTLAVVFGDKFARYEVAFLSVTPFILNLGWFFFGCIKTAIFPYFCLPLAIIIIRKIWNEPVGPIYNKFLAQGALLNLCFGFLLSFGIYLD